MEHTNETEEAKALGALASLARLVLGDKLNEVKSAEELKRLMNESGTKPVATQYPHEIDKLRKLYRGNIPAFAKDVFGVELTKEQVAFCDEFSGNSHITRTLPIGWGKSLCAAILTWWSLICLDHVQVTIFAPSESSLKGGIWKNVRILHDRMEAPLADQFEANATRIVRKSFRQGCFTEIRIASVGAARGIHMKNNFVFVDEANGVSEDVINSLHGIMGDMNPKLCLFYTKLPEMPTKPVAPVSEVELFNEALRSLRAIVCNDVKADPMWLEAIQYQLQNADWLANMANNNRPEPPKPSN